MCLSVCLYAYARACPPVHPVSRRPAQVHTLAAKHRDAAAPKTLAELGIDGCTEVDELNPDVILLDLNKPVQLAPERLVSACKNLPFEHFPAEGQVLTTVVDGRLVYNHLPLKGEVP